MSTSEPKAQKNILNPEAENLVFSPYTLRLIMGFIAFALSPVVIIITAEITSSISASYYTNARDVFVGLLFVIGAFLLAYNGRSRDLTPDTVGKFWQDLGKFWSGAIEFRIGMRKIEERVVSLIGGVAAICSALFPTARDTCNDITCRIHIAAAVILFSTIAYFCLIAFRGQVKDATDKEVKKKRRGRIYSFCGWGIIVVMLGLLAMQFTMPVLARNTRLPITFIAETVALVLFGISWMTASKIFIWLADEEEQHKISMDDAEHRGKVVLDQVQTA